MRKVYMGILLSLMIALMAGAVHGAISCAITDQSYLYNDHEFYVTISGTWDNENTSIAKANITFSGCGALNLENATPANNTGLSFNFSLNPANIGTLRDDTQCTLTARLYNLSGGAYKLAQGGTCSAETAYPDSTLPVVTLSTPTSGSKDVDGKMTLTYTCSNSSSATLYLEDVGGYSAYTMTESSDSCTYAATILTNGFHSHYIIGSDGLNTTTSSVSTVEVRKPGGYIYDEQGNILQDTAGATAPVKSGNVVTNIVNGIFDFIFGIFNSIFSIFK